MRIRALSIVAVILGLGQLAGCSSLPRMLAPPRAELVGLQLLQGSFDGQRFAVSLELTNPNPVAIPVLGVEFNVRLASEGLLDGRSLVPFTLPAGGQRTIDVEIFSNVISSASRLRSIVQGPGNVLEYELQGELTLDARLREPLGFYFRGQVPLEFLQ
jgi:LEA14-like dessication related protein